MRCELPRNTGANGRRRSDRDPITSKSARSVRGGSICAISPRSPITFMMAARLTGLEAVQDGRRLVDLGLKAKGE